MAADPVVYCLEQVTDYHRFEDFCHDVMYTQGYKNLEPLGKSNDRGRDALHSCKDGTSTIFAYSVREDWKAKLKEDSEKIRGHGHACATLVFMTTARFTANERDIAVADAMHTYSWKLDLFGIERIAVNVRNQPRLVVNHPQIFTPAFFPRHGSVPVASRDLVVIDNVDADTAVAQWLARRLTILGYKVWCRGLAPTAGSALDETLKELVELRAAACVFFLSSDALRDLRYASRRITAHRVRAVDSAVRIIPAVATTFDRSMLEPETHRLEHANFDAGWASGLKSVLDVCQSAAVPQSSAAPENAIASYFPESVVLHERELLVSNLFALQRLPEVIHRFAAASKPPDATDARWPEWAHRRTAEGEYLAFHSPPHALAKDVAFRKRGGVAWREFPDVDGIKTRDLIRELVRKSLFAECVRRGLIWSAEEQRVYFPPQLLKNEFLRYISYDGTSCQFVVTGERKYGGGVSAPYFRYALAPTFTVSGHDDDLEVLVRVGVRIVDSTGKPLTPTQVNARRKQLCKGWWNKEWRDRTLGIIAFLAKDAETVTIGLEPREQLVIRRHPCSWEAPYSIDEIALERLGSTVEEDMAWWWEAEDDEP